MTITFVNALIQASLRPAALYLPFVGAALAMQSIGAMLDVRPLLCYSLVCYSHLLLSLL